MLGFDFPNLKKRAVRLGLMLVVTLPKSFPPKSFFPEVKPNVYQLLMAKKCLLDGAKALH